MGVPRPSLTPSWSEKDTKVEQVSDRPRIHVTYMVAESSFHGIDSHRTGPVAVASTAAEVGMLEPLVPQYKVEAAVAPAAAAAVVAVAVAVAAAAAAAAAVVVVVAVAAAVDVVAEVVGAAAVASDAVAVDVAVAAGVGVGVDGNDA